MDPIPEEDDYEEVSEWRKLKQSLTVNKMLIPLKLTMLLYYGGKSFIITEQGHTFDCFNARLNGSCVRFPSVPDATDGPSGLDDRRNRYHIFRSTIYHLHHATISR